MESNKVLNKVLIDKDKVIKAIITKDRLTLECLGCYHMFHFDLHDDLRFLREVCITAEKERNNGK